MYKNIANVMSVANKWRVMYGISNSVQFHKINIVTIYLDNTHNIYYVWSVRSKKLFFNVSLTFWHEKIFSSAYDKNLVISVTVLLV